MCLILLSHHAHPGLPLVVAANRDEFHARNAARVAYWDEHPAILAGRDMEAMGTWMGISRGGRFCAVTNFRGGRDPKAVESRGALVSRFLGSEAAAGDYVAGVALRSGSYSGFNLLAWDGDELWWLSNRGGDARRLVPGTYGLGNLLLDSPEVAGDTQRFAQALAYGDSIEPLFGVLAAAKIVAPGYGTRCSTVLVSGGDGRLQYAERAFDAGGAELDTLRFDLYSKPRARG